MKCLSKILMCVAIVSFVTMGCKKNPDDPIHTGNMQTVALQGKVMDTSGNPLSGVKVTTGTASAISGNNGKFSFKEAEVINKRAVIKFEKSGYFTLTRSGVKQNEMFIEAVMHPKGNSDISIQTTFDTKDETTLKVPAGMEVKFPASSIMRADGSAYSGTVRADMLYLDPNNENFTGMMPGGDLAAIRTDNSEVMLISWGMTDVVLTDESGKPLQIKNGSEAETTFPIPAGMQSNPPATIPLWSFNDAKGIWIEEGVATLQGNVYVGTTTHFSWVNLDEPARRVTIKGEVKDCEDKAVPYVKVTADQTSAYTNSKGEFTVIVPEQTAVTVKVTANGGSDSHHVPGQSGESTYSGIKLIVPCDEEEDDDDEPGTLTHVEKGAIKYDMQGSITAVTFANKGWRYRWDFFENETSKISEVAYIINHYNKTFWVGSNYDGEVNWMDLPFEYAASPYTISIDEEVMKPYQQPGNINIAGKSCKVFIYNYMGMVLKYASWNGLIMMMEQDGEMIMIAVAATIDVPEAAFTKTFNVSWLP